MRLQSKAGLLIVCYALLLLTTDLILPLRIPEILQILAAHPFSWGRMIGWIAQTPGAAPLSYFAQLPFLLIWHHAPLAARFSSLVFAIAASVLLWKLFKEIPLAWTEFALAAFMLLPLHYRSATEARAAEQALFLTVLQLLLFLRLIRSPSLKRSVLYGVALTISLYTEPYSFLPAIGQLLFLLRFVGRAHERRVVWVALVPTIAPPLIFLPYGLWAHLQISSQWISGPPAPLAPGWYVTCAVLLAVLLAGSLAGLWTTFLAVSRNISKRIFLFSVAGGIVATLAAGQILWAIPGIILLFFAALERLSIDRARRIAAACGAALLILCSIPLDALYLATRTEDVQAQAAAISRELMGDSCVVFISQGLSKDLFVLFQPRLASHECLNFFHHRVILAIHPYVAADERANADSYFSGLGFHQLRRLSFGRGEVVILEQGK
jgi:hypothetical protein